MGGGVRLIGKVAQQTSKSGKTSRAAKQTSEGGTTTTNKQGGTTNKQGGALLKLQRLLRKTLKINYLCLGVYLLYYFAIKY